MAALEALTLDGLALHTGGLTMLSLSMPPPPGLAEWIKGADSNGALLSRAPLYDNRVIEARIGVDQTATRDLTLAKIGTLLDKLQECAQNENGLPLAWIPADSALAAITFRCLLGEIVDLPIDWESGWLSRAPIFTVRLTCLPFGEGLEVLAGSVTSSDIMPTLTLTGVAGDVPALGRLVVTDAATQARRWVAWGTESRWLPTSGAPSLVIDSASMVTAGFAGVTATRTGAYSGGTNNVIGATLRTQSQAICGLGNLSHVGSFRPQLRFYASATTMAVRLTYQTLDGPFRSLSYKVPVAVGFNHVDLGLVTIPASKLGTQRWTGRIEAYSTATGGETFQVDVMPMVPAELFGRARGSYAYGTGIVTAYDEFTSITSGTVLNARVAPLGGTWATSGATTDFTAADFAGGEWTARSTQSDVGFRRAILGATNFTNVELGVDYYYLYGSVVYAGTVAPIGAVVIARSVDASNYLRGGVEYGSTGTFLNITKVIAGTATIIGSKALPVVGKTSFPPVGTVRMVVFSTGVARLDLLNSGGGVLHSVMAVDTALATGGTLATGKPGFADTYESVTAGPPTRYYDNFYAATPPVEPIAIQTSQSLEVRSDIVLREDSTGTYAGPPPEYVGGRFTVAPAGVAARSTRIAVMAKRNDVETTADDFIADSTTVQAYVTPRYLAVRH